MRLGLGLDMEVGGGGPTIVGGVAIGAAGTGIYSGYTLSWGDDFTSLDIVGPAAPRGRWYTTLTYSPGTRGTDTLLDTQYDTDPLMTGHIDSNRGAAVGFNNMSVANSVLSLQARKSTAAEQLHMCNARPQVSAMIAGIGAILFHPGAIGTGDIIIDYRVRHGTSNPAGWHPDLWTDSFNAPIGSSFNDNNQSNFEGNSTGSYIYQNDWSGAPSGSFVTTKYGGPYNHDASFHTITFRQNTTNLVLYKDGVLQETDVTSANAANKPQYPIVTSHVYDASFNGDAYSQASWDADANGATLEVDYIRVWRRTGNVHYRPLITMADQNVTYGQSTVIQLPTAAAIWGTTPTNEYLQGAPHEVNEPGITLTTSYTQFPPGVTYDTGTRQLTINITSGNSGRINFVLGAWEAGGTCEPFRFAVNLSPKITQGDLAAAVGAVSFDLYSNVYCGVLVPKVLSVSGLGSSGLSFNPATCLITGNFDGNAINGITLTGTNSVGQSAQGTFAITGFDASTLALLARMSVQPDGTRQSLINNLIVGLKADGLWTLLDYLQIYAAHDAQASLLNWKQNANNGTSVNAADWLVNAGYKSNGTTSYIDTGYNPTAFGVATVNDNSMGVYMASDAATSAVADFGSASNSINVRDASGKTNTRSSSTTVNTSTPVHSDARTHFLVNRSASGTYTVTRAGAIFTTISQASTALSNGNYFVCARNDDLGTASGFVSTRRTAASHAGLSLTSGQRTSLYNRLLTFMTGVGL